jgi:ABC-2 type transport system ATP-binding protein
MAIERQRPKERPAPQAVVEAIGLTKRYDATWALRGVDLRLEEGEILGLLGPNGAGKTTTVEILEGFVRRDAGRVDVLGADPADARQEMLARVGIVLQSCGFDPFLTVAETLRQRSRWYRAPRPVEEVLALVGLEGQRDSKAQVLSGGQQRRFDFALALIGDPKVLFLDEPTTGFDPSARRSAWDVILTLRSLGTSVLLTTHYLDEASALADRVAVLVDGQVIAEGPPETIGDEHRTHAQICFELPGADMSDLPVDGRIDGAGMVTIDAPDLIATLHAVTTWACRARLMLDDLEIVRPSLEDAYLRLIGDQGSE